MLGLPNNRDRRPGVTRYGMNVLRTTASLAHAVPGVAVRISHDDTTLLTSCPPPAPGGEGEWLPLCAFRATVGAALQHLRAGRTIGILGLAPGVDPRVELGGRGGTVIHPGGVVAALHGHRFIHAFATLLAPAKVHGVMESSQESRVGVHHDDVTDVSLVFTETTPHPSQSDPMIVAEMQELLIRCAGAELAIDLVPTAAGGSPL